MRKLILHVFSMLSMSDNSTSPTSNVSKTSPGGIRTLQFNTLKFFQSIFFDLTILRQFPRKCNSPFEILCPYILDMTKSIVIQIEQFLSREYSRVCGEYKGNFKVCLNHHHSIILIISVPDFLLLVYCQLLFLVQDISFFQISSFSFFSQSLEICLTLKSLPILEITSIAIK